MKAQDRQNGPSGLPEKTGWLCAWYITVHLAMLSNIVKTPTPWGKININYFVQWASLTQPCPGGGGGGYV